MPANTSSVRVRGETYDFKRFQRLPTWWGQRGAIELAVGQHGKRIQHNER